MHGRLGVVALVLATACSSKSEVKTNGSGSASGKPFTIVALAEMRGQIGPCGCTTDPLGDLARTSQLAAQIRAAGPTLVLDAGSLLYSKNPIPAHLETQEELKADLLISTYKEALGVAAVGLGPADLAKGPDKLRVPRHAVNLAADTKVAVESPKIVDAGGARVGVFGVIAQGAVPTDALAITDPIAAGKAAAQKLRADGAEVVVALVQAASKRDAVKLVREIGGADIAIAGLGASAPEPEDVEPEATKVDNTWLVIPGNRGQVISRLDVHVREPGPLVDAIGAGAAKAKIATIDKQLAAADADLVKMKSDKDADPAFVKQKQAERDQLAKDKTALEKTPLAVPAKGSYFTLEQIRINKPLACDTKVQSNVTAFYTAAGQANVKAAAGQKVAPPAKGQAGYVGTEACSDCHSDAVDFWNTTRHAHAWETLVERGQQFDYDCIGCHVTGWDKPGGSNLANNETLRDVQCETCHGPGSIHVAKGGEEKPPAVVRMPDEKMCATQCHTKEHSDTFDLKPYLRDVTGPGHGANLRTQLGDGPTGAELRKAGLAKAGKLGPNCVR
jgi:2',3'-cyclic-nucleotide 2'-phosphodiesterase (5'-nucleotidase family)